MLILVCFCLFVGRWWIPFWNIASGTTQRWAESRETRTVGRCTCRTRSRSTVTRSSGYLTKGPTSTSVGLRGWCLGSRIHWGRSQSREGRAGMRSFCSSRRTSNGMLKSTSRLSAIGYSSLLSCFGCLALISKDFFVPLNNELLKLPLADTENLSSAPELVLLLWCRIMMALKDYHNLLA